MTTDRVALQLKAKNAVLKKAVIEGKLQESSVPGTPSTPTSSAKIGVLPDVDVRL